MSGSRHRLAELVRGRRLSFGLSRKELAKRAHLSAKYLGEIERGETNVTVDALEAIMRALTWDPWTLFRTEATPLSKKSEQLLVQAIVATRQHLDWVFRLLMGDDATASSGSDRGLSVGEDTRQRRREVHRREPRLRGDQSNVAPTWHDRRRSAEVEDGGE
jgi:transcriptional regulator with XRE-family HTH domain